MAQRLENRPCGGRYGDIVQAIGNTPLVELKRLSPKPGVRIWAKLESHNPTGSVKDRVARALIEDAEEKGAIAPGQTILEPTSGNTGISLAMICSRKGYPLKVVMPDNVTPERTQLLQMYGAEIVYSPGDQGSNGAVAMALEMAEADASYYMPYQYGNAANPRAHYDGTAPEILEELDEISAFVAGLGTGGTLMGNGRRLREELGDAVKIVAAEPMQGEPVQGLRSLDDGFIPPIIDLSLLDRKIFVTNHDAIVWTRQAARRGGHLRRRLLGRDRLDRRADRRRDGRGQHRLHRLRRRLEVPLLRDLHAARRGDREPGLHRLVVVRPGGGCSPPAPARSLAAAAAPGEPAAVRRRRCSAACSSSSPRCSPPTSACRASSGASSARAPRGSSARLRDAGAATRESVGRRRGRPARGRPRARAPQHGRHRRRDRHCSATRAAPRARRRRDDRLAPSTPPSCCAELGRDPIETPFPDGRSA